MSYNQKPKGFGCPKPPKYDDVKFLTVDQVKRLLSYISKSDSKHKTRDHALMYLSFMFGLREGEAVILERRHFRNIDKGVAHIPTLKTRGEGAPEKEPPFVEGEVISYVKKYLKGLPGAQKWLFLASNGNHISTSWCRKLFAHWARVCGLDPLYSYHSLRHGRGVIVWEMTKDIEAVRLCLRHKDQRAAQIYTHLSPERRNAYRAAMEKASKGIGETK